MRDKDRLMRISSTDFLEWGACFDNHARFLTLVGKYKESRECDQMHHDICEKWHAGKEIKKLKQKLKHRR